MSLEREIRRPSRRTCRRCGLLGAALAVMSSAARRIIRLFYKVVCAVQKIDCSWDVVSDDFAFDPKVIPPTSYSDMLNFYFFIK